LNVGGTIFETYISTLLKYPDSLLGAMFSARNVPLAKMGGDGSYFFDRSPVCFEAILNVYRTGRLFLPTSVTTEAFAEELDYWNLPRRLLRREPKGKSLAEKLAKRSLKIVKKQVGPVLEKLHKYVVESVSEAARSGRQTCSIEFRAEVTPEYYAFLSNFSHRELLLRELQATQLRVEFSDVVISGHGHSYVLTVILWNRYTQLDKTDITSALEAILEQLATGIEVKTTHNILSVGNHSYA